MTRGKLLSLKYRCGEFRPPGRLRVKSHFTDLLAFPHESSEIRSRRPGPVLP
ncbi:chromosomal replication initiator DnaA domain protein [Burkholderia pseudomallei MSHR5608]|nr:chromosomal replication initiator DnaA domain protein [Burkholderia pseudomallei MSHR5608]